MDSYDEDDNVRIACMMGWDIPQPVEQVSHPVLLAGVLPLY